MIYEVYMDIIIMTREDWKKKREIWEQDGGLQHLLWVDQEEGKETIKHKGIVYKGNFFYFS